MAGTESALTMIDSSAQQGFRVGIPACFARHAQRFQADLVRIKSRKSRAEAGEDVQSAFCVSGGASIIAFADRGSRPTGLQCWLHPGFLRPRFPRRWRAHARSRMVLPPNSPTAGPAFIEQSCGSRMEFNRDVDHRCATTSTVSARRSAHSRHWSQPWEQLHSELRQDRER